MRRAITLLAVAVAGSALTATASTSASVGWKRFVSKRYAYSIRYPSAWTARPATTSAINGVPDVHESSLDGFTLHRGLHTELDVRVGSQRVPSGTTLEDWTATEAQAIDRDYGCVPKDREDLTVGGEPAKLLTYRPCPPAEGLDFLFIAAVHGDRGFQLYWLSRVGHERRDRALFLRFVKTFRFRR